MQQGNSLPYIHSLQIKNCQDIHNWFFLKISNDNIINTYNTLRFIHKSNRKCIENSWYITITENSQHSLRFFKKFGFDLSGISFPGKAIHCACTRPGVKYMNILYFKYIFPVYLSIFKWCGQINYFYMKYLKVFWNIFR